MQTLQHTLAPVYDAHSRVLVLGSFPSPQSRETGFYYGHPQNRFWQVLAAVFGRPVPASVEEKKTLLLENGVALFDVCRSCEIHGASDASIRNAVPNDLTPLLTASRITRVCCNGKTSFRLYSRLIEPVTGLPARCLPSTSPANAAWTLARLTEAYRILREPEPAHL